MEDNSVDSIVTDPPYGLSFMGRKWDYDVPSVDIWVGCLRVLKPGGHLLAFAGTRTQHRMAVNIEDAGFEIRDMIAWCYGSGWPKSHNLKGEWEGFGTALKPALEPITVARKPFKGTVAANVLEHGTGAINIDGCRVGTSKNVPASVSKRPPANCYGRYAESGETPGVGGHDPNIGRWPSNLLHDGSDEVTELFPDDAARFFYQAKCSKADREDGNNHPTVKPTDLMAYLCRLVTPPGGIVLDPFMGSGSTGKAAMREGFGFIGIEREDEYHAIALGRLMKEEMRDKQLSLTA
jgi:DNA modification methylase